MNISFKNSFTFSLVSSCVIFITYFAGYYHHARLTPGDSFPLLAEAHRILREHGLGEPPPNPALEYGMIRGMLQAYGDPHSSFAEPTQHELQSHDLQGNYGGIGTEIGRDSLGYPVLYPFPESPAGLAGIQDGDRLVQIEQLEVNPEMPVEELQAAIRGPVGKSINLSVARPPDYHILHFNIRREEIRLPSVTWNLEPVEQRLGIIRVNLIAATTPEEIQKAVTELEEKGATHFALDLRNNFGGLLESGIETARLFLKQGIVIEQQYKSRPVESFAIEQPGSLVEVPLVVLVNQSTASAAEIIAGALQVHQRALIIGNPTYGKDTIQLIFELSDGSSIHVTAARWWVPGLEGQLAETGLVPDIIIPADAPADTDPAIQAAISSFWGEK